VTSVTCPVRKYVLRMRNRKLRHIRPSGAFWPEVTKSRDWNRPYPEVVLTGSRFCAFPAFLRAFFLVVEPEVTRRSLDPLSVFPWVYATGSCATSVVTEGHVTPSEVSLGCSLRRPRPIFNMVTGTSHPRLIFSMVTGTKHPRPIFSVMTGTSPDYLPLLFSYSVYIGCVVLQGCLRSHCGISKSQMENLIPTCIVSS
jgi:hypothetical protein